jgi:hypothetical protein
MPNGVWIGGTIDSNGPGGVEVIPPSTTNYTTLSLCAEGAVGDWFLSFDVPF